jgi:hypothetical protein
MPVASKEEVSSYPLLICLTPLIPFRENPSPLKERGKVS